MAGCRKGTVCAVEEKNHGLLFGGEKVNKQDPARRLIVALHPKSPASEAFRSLRTNLHFAGSRKSTQIIMVTSAGPGEGKSTTLANLGVTMAQSGKRVLVIDADLRRPTQHKIFSVSSQPGLSNLLVDSAKPDDVIRPTRIDHLALLPSGPIPPNPSELLDSPEAEALWPRLAQGYDQILIDTPPALAVTDAMVLASQVDGVVVVVEAGETRRDKAKESVDMLNRAGGRVLGAVLNGVRHGDGHRYYYYYGASQEQA